MNQTFQLVNRNRPDGFGIKQLKQQEEQLNRLYLKQKKLALMKESRSECSFGSEGRPVCGSKSDLQIMRAIIEENEGEADDQVIDRMKSLLNCSTEKCIFVHPDMKDQGLTPIGQLQKLFKPNGPATNDSALDNIQITSVLGQFEKRFPDFKSLGFAMIDDFRPNGWLIDWKKALFSTGKKRFALIVNTDQRGNRGKHWFVLFFDFSKWKEDSYHQALAFDKEQNGIAKNRRKSPVSFSKICTIEYFNSSGKALNESLHRWLVSLRDHLVSQIAGINLYIVNNSRTTSQASYTECGVFCIVYVFERLVGTKHTEFLVYRISDQDLYQARFNIFLNQ